MCAPAGVPCRKGGLVGRRSNLAALVISCGLSAAIVAALVVWTWRKRSRGDHASIAELMGNLEPMTDQDRDAREAYQKHADEQAAAGVVAPAYDDLDDTQKRQWGETARANKRTEQ